MSSFLQQGEVLSNTIVAENLFLLEVECEREIAPKPGQFINFYPAEDSKFVLPRPFSIFEYKEKNIYVLYKVVGRFTHFMSTWKKGVKVQVGGPFGNGFSLKGKNHVLVAGGTGIAALNILGRELQRFAPVLYYGAKTKEFLVPLDILSFAPSYTVISTEDGSSGKKGLITDFFRPKGNETIYAAGPIEMLKKVVAKAGESKVFVSIESRMACGISVCMGCGVFTTHGEVKRVCKEGPVFDGKEIKWEDLNFT